MKTQSLFRAFVALFQLQTVVEGKIILVEDLREIPSGWTKLRDANGDQWIKLRIALEQPNLDKFEQTLYNISYPLHPLYGQHLSREELRYLVSPTGESIAAVLGWLRTAGVDEKNIEKDGEWINFKATVSKASELLGTEFGVYRHVGTVKERIRTLR